MTGMSGTQLHMGNEPARGPEDAPTLDRKRGSNVTDLSGYFDTSGYLTAHSDIVALMVLEDQTSIENAMTHIAYTTRAAVKYANEMMTLNFDRKHIEEETTERINHACEPLVRALVGADESPLTSPLIPSNGFAKKYASGAPPDPEGRRLSELDLKTRLYRYPCSPMIYSNAFLKLPTVAKDRVLSRIKEVLSGKDRTIHLKGVAPQDAITALAILNSTFH